MVRRTRIALFSVAALSMAAGGWMWMREASAQIDPLPPVDTAVVCSGSRDHFISVNNGPVVDAATIGAIEAVVGRTTTTQDGRRTTQLTVTNTHTDGYVEGVGNLVITLDSSRQSPPSSLTANQTGSTFPATQVMRFYPVFVLNDEVFKSKDPVQVVSSSVTSFPPKPGTVYVLTNALQLKSARGNTISLTPGKAFTISGSTSS